MQAKMLASACSFPLPEALSGPVLELTQVGDLRNYDRSVSHLIMWAPSLKGGMRQFGDSIAVRNSSLFRVIWLPSRK